MLTYIVRRILYSIPVLVASSFISFTFVSLSRRPAREPPREPEDELAARSSITSQHVYHLDQSLPVRYWYWVQDVFTHKLGVSLAHVAADLAGHHARDGAHGCRSSCSRS